MPIIRERLINLVLAAEDIAAANLKLQQALYNAKRRAMLGEDLPTVWQTLLADLSSITTDPSSHQIIMSERAYLDATKSQAVRNYTRLVKRKGKHVPKSRQYPLAPSDFSQPATQTAQVTQIRVDARPLAEDEERCPSCNLPILKSDTECPNCDWVRDLQVPLPAGATDIDYITPSIVRFKLPGSDQIHSLDRRTGKITTL